MVSQLTCHRGWRIILTYLHIYHRLITDNHNGNRSKSINTWNLERHGTGDGIHDEIPRPFFRFFPVFNISRTTVGRRECCLLHYDVNRSVRYSVYPDVTQSFPSGMNLRATFARDLPMSWIILQQPMRLLTVLARKLEESLCFSVLGFAHRLEGEKWRRF
jgi:hypothetical protein